MFRSFSKSQHISYEDIINFSQFCVTKTIKAHYIKLSKFVQEINQNILFIFGPSGCGKRKMVENFMAANEIPYSLEFEKQQLAQKFDGEQMKQQDDQYHLIPIRKIIQQSLKRQTQAQKIQIFFDFPSDVYYGQGYSWKPQQFRASIYQEIAKTRAKIIFILNSEIYNPYYILNEGNNILNLTSLVNVSVIKMKPVIKTQIKQIIRSFLENYPAYKMNVDDIRLNQIIELCNGDVRKALNEVYYATLQKLATKSNLTKSKKKVKNNCQKISLFYLLGKILYAKRLDPLTGQSRYYSQQQLIRQDPPFYFDPIEILQRSRVNVRIFYDMLFQNYIEKFSKIKDVRKFMSLLCEVDITFDKYIFNRSMLEGMLQNNLWLLGQLLTWGAILYNKNSILIKKQFQYFKKPEIKIINNEIKVRKQLIHKYLPKIKIINYVIFTSILRGTLGAVAQNTKTMDRYPILYILEKRIRTKKQFNEELTKISEKEQQYELQRQSNVQNIFLIKQQQQNAKRLALFQMFNEDSKSNESSDYD